MIEITTRELAKIIIIKIRVRVTKTISISTMKEIREYVNQEKKVSWAKYKIYVADQ